MNREIGASGEPYRPTPRGALVLGACALVATCLWLRSLAYLDSLIVRMGPYTLKVTVAGAGLRMGVVPDRDYKAGWQSLRGSRPAYPWVRIPHDRLRRWLGCDIQFLRAPQWPPEAAVVFPVAALAVFPALAAAILAWRRRRQSTARGFPPIAIGANK